ncbi:MAG: NAD(P)-binding domain-containing protein [Bacteroidales bacterium]|nr:NAD(P)-binding domain-containing protein [Bacteroidales bacterium]
MKKVLVHRRKFLVSSSMKQLLLKKIAERKIVAGVVGLGYVGLPLAVEKAKAGFKTIGFDMQKSKVDMVNAGHNYIGDVVNADLKKLVKEGRLKATEDFSFIKDVDFVAICVPTPLDDHQQPDISYVKSSTESIAKVHSSKHDGCLGINNLSRYNRGVA